MIKIKLDEILDNTFFQGLRGRLSRAVYVTMLFGMIALGPGCGAAVQNTTIPKNPVSPPGEVQNDYLESDMRRQERHAAIPEHKTEPSEYSHCRQSMFCLSGKESLGQPEIDSCYGQISEGEKGLYDNLVTCISSSCKDDGESAKDRINNRIQCIYDNCSEEMNGCYLGKQEGSNGCHDTIKCITAASDEKIRQTCLDSSSTKAKEAILATLNCAHDKCKSDTECFSSVLLGECKAEYKSCMGVGK